jgi:hypothetical protein
VVTPMVRGLLGLEADATGNRITVAPQIPASWDEVTVNNFRLGEQRWDLAMRKSFANASTGGRTLYLVARRQQHSSLRTEFSFELAFPPGTEVTNVGGDNKFNMVRSPHHSVCRFRITTSPESPDQMNVSVNYLPGIEVLTERPAPHPGDTSQSLKLLSTSIDGSTAHIVIEGRGGRTYNFKVRSRKPIINVINAEKRLSLKTDQSLNETSLSITMPETESGGYVRQTVQLELGQR